MNRFLALGVAGLFFYSFVNDPAQAKTVSQEAKTVSQVDTKSIAAGPGWAVPPLPSVHSGNAVAIQADFAPNVEFTGQSDDPYTIGGVTYLGALAYAGTQGIARVGFILNNGTEVFADSKEINPVTNIPSYWVRLKLSNLGPGIYTLVINGYPQNPALGVRRIVRTFFANYAGIVPKETRYVSPNGSTNGSTCGAQYNPCDFATGLQSAVSTSLFGPNTIKIMFTPGNYSLTPLSNAPTGPQPAWAIFSGVPGQPRSAVNITGFSPNGLGIKRVRYSNMTFRAALNGRWLGQHSDEAWLDNVDIVGNGQSAPALGANGWAANFTKVALTRSTVKDERGCAFLADYVTEAFFWKVLCDHNRLGFMNIRSGLVLDSEIRDLSAGTTQDHPDAFGATLGGDIENLILQTVRVENALAQLFFLKETHARNMYVANIVGNQHPSSIGQSQIMSGLSPNGQTYRVSVNFHENTLIQTLNITDNGDTQGNPTVSNSSFANNVFQQVSLVGISPAQLQATNTTFVNNHFSNTYGVSSGAAFGTPIPGALVLGVQASTGSPGFINPQSPSNLYGPYDWRPGANSVLLNRSAQSITGSTAAGGSRLPSSATQLFSTGAY